MKRSNFNFWLLVSVGLINAFIDGPDTLKSIFTVICLAGALILDELRENHDELIATLKKKE